MLKNIKILNVTAGQSVKVSNNTVDHGYSFGIWNYELMKW